MAARCGSARHGEAPAQTLLRNPIPIPSRTATEPLSASRTSVAIASHFDAGSRYIRGPDVATAGPTYVLATKKLHQQKAKRNGAEQVPGDGDDDVEV